MNESDARAALAALGIKNPSRQLIEDWLRANSEPPAQAEQEPNAQAQPARPHPSSTSALESTLRSRGELVRKAGRRRAGRPRVVASFYGPLARVMADGTSLAQALRILDIQLDKRQQRALYRSTEFRRMYQEARRQYLRQWPRKRRSRRNDFLRSL